MNLDGDTLGTKVTIMKWRALKGDKDGALECALAPEVRDVGP